jgi:biopolymer transport protein ExbD
MNVFELDDDENFLPQITPLVDVVLLVLIFFIVTTTFANVPKELDLELPEASASDGQVASELRMFVTSDGRVRFRNQWVEQSELLAVLKRLKQNRQNPVLLISADARTAHQHLVDVIVSAKQAGIENFGFEIVLKENQSTSP